MWQNKMNENMKKNVCSSIFHFQCLFFISKVTSARPTHFSMLILFANQGNLWNNSIEVVQFIRYHDYAFCGIFSVYKKTSIIRNSSTMYSLS